MTDAEKTPLAVEIAYYAEIKDSLLKEHENKFVLIKGRQNFGIFSSFADAHKKGLEEFGVDDFLIQDIRKEEIVNIYSPLLFGNMVNA